MEWAIHVGITSWVDRAWPDQWYEQWVEGSGFTRESDVPGAACYRCSDSECTGSNSTRSAVSFDADSGELERYICETDTTGNALELL